jgi:hypothetical protein
MERAVEALREGELSRIGECLISEHQHAVLVHAGTQRGQGAWIVQLREVDRSHLCGKQRMQGAELGLHSHLRIIERDRAGSLRGQQVDAQPK